MDGMGAHYKPILEQAKDIVRSKMQPELDKMLLMAVFKGDAEQIGRSIKGGANINAYSDGNTMLMYAVGWGKGESVRKLLQEGADPNLLSYNKETALVWAVYMERSDIAKILIEEGKGLDIDARTDGGVTALMIACLSEKNIDIVRLLLSRGADPTLKDDKGIGTSVYASNNKEALGLINDAIRKRLGFRGE